MSAEVWQNQDAAELHQLGLQTCLNGKFDEADDWFERAYTELQDDAGDAEIEHGHLYRDWARVYAGLGSASRRDSAIKEAINEHSSAFSKGSGKPDQANRTAATELAATYHVSARIQLARSLETTDKQAREAARCFMAGDWSESLNLFERHGNNPDYLHQMLAHGVLGMAVFGHAGDRLITNRIADAAWAELADMSKIRKAAVLAGHAALLRTVRPLVRPFASRQVAGPYMVRPTIS